MYFFNPAIAFVTHYAAVLQSEARVYASLLKAEADHVMAAVEKKLRDAKDASDDFMENTILPLVREVVIEFLDIPHPSDFCASESPPPPPPSTPQVPDPSRTVRLYAMSGASFIELEGYPLLLAEQSPLLPPPPTAKATSVFEYQKQPSHPVHFPFIIGLFSFIFIGLSAFLFAVPTPKHPKKKSKSRSRGSRSRSRSRTGSRPRTSEASVQTAFPSPFRPSDIVYRQSPTVIIINWVFITSENSAHRRSGITEIEIAANNDVTTSPVSSQNIPREQQLPQATRADLPFIVESASSSSTGSSSNSVSAASNTGALVNPTSASSNGQAWHSNVDAISESVDGANVASELGINQASQGNGDGVPAEGSNLVTDTEANVDDSKVDGQSNVASLIIAPPGTDENLRPNDSPDHPEKGLGSEDKSYAVSDDEEEAGINHSLGTSSSIWAPGADKSGQISSSGCRNASSGPTSKGAPENSSLASSSNIVVPIRCETAPSRGLESSIWATSTRDSSSSAGPSSRSVRPPATVASSSQSLSIRGAAKRVAARSSAREAASSQSGPSRSSSGGDRRSNRFKRPSYSPAPGA